MVDQLWNWRKKTVDKFAKKNRPTNEQINNFVLLFFQRIMQIFANENRPLCLLTTKLMLTTAISRIENRHLEPGSKFRVENPPMATRPSIALTMLHLRHNELIRFGYHCSTGWMDPALQPLRLLWFFYKLNMQIDGPTTTKFTRHACIHTRERRRIYVQRNKKRTDTLYAVQIAMRHLDRWASH